MLKDGIRTCDVCAEVIPKGTTYSVSLIRERHVELFREAMEKDPGMAATYTEDEQGNVHLEICLDCKLKMSEPGETVH